MSRAPLFVFIAAPGGDQTTTTACGRITATGEVFRFQFKGSHAELYIYPAEVQARATMVADFPLEDRYLRYEADLWLGDADGRAGRTLTTGLLTHWLHHYAKAKSAPPVHPLGERERLAAARQCRALLRDVTEFCHDVLSKCRSASDVAGDVERRIAELQDFGECFDYLPRVIKHAQSMARDLVARLRSIQTSHIS